MEIDQTLLDRLLRLPLGEGAYHAVERLEDAGFEAWWVGGGVRDLLLEQLPTEIDIATNAKPEAVATLFPKSDTSAAALGAAVIAVKGSMFEVTTFREESDTIEGRAPTAVKFVDRLTDAKRRDFTVNAIYFHPLRRTIDDPTGGTSDLHERLVRFIGEPSVRITHDPLRLLRAVRLRANIDGQYHPETFQALSQKATEIKRLSGSRCFEELQKILVGKGPDRALEDLWEFKILQEILPELARCKGIAQPADFHREGDVWEHMLLCLRAFTEDHGIDVRLAALFHDCGKAETFSLSDRIRFNEHASVSRDLTVAALKRMQCPRQRTDKIGWLVGHHMTLGEFIDMESEPKARWYYHPWFTELLQLFWLDIQGTEPADTSGYDRLLDDYNHFLDSHPRPPKPLLGGDEVMEILGLKPGERVGELLQQLEAAQLRKEVTTRAEAQEFLKRIAK
ncbi:MAG TPA: HD domain-containing protein [Candidatus Peribacteraceae bacterium]|nr:HD domain-containing protein [Candidatus Peribacteraceae bacterium]